MKKFKRTYHYLGDALRIHFGGPIYKVSLNTGFLCPNRDGTKGKTGCYYCGEGSHFVDPVHHHLVSPEERMARQLEYGKLFFNKRYGVNRFIAYFQAYTSTYGPLDQLEAMLKAVTSDPTIVGIHLSTRPDCLSDAVLRVLKKYMLGQYHCLELGLESCHDSTLDLIHRGHHYVDFVSTLKRVQNAGFQCAAHVILGLPNETEEMMCETIDRLVALKINGIKFHQLHVVKNSVFETWYQEGRLPLLDRESYARLLATLLVRIPWQIVIHRLLGDAPKQFMVAPDWCFEKSKSLAFLEQYLQHEGIVQGSQLGQK